MRVHVEFSVLWFPPPSPCHWVVFFGNGWFTSRSWNHKDETDDSCPIKQRVGGASVFCWIFNLSPATPSEVISLSLSQGLTIKPLVKWLKVPRSTSRKPTINEEIHERVSARLVLVSALHVSLKCHCNIQWRAWKKHWRVCVCLSRPLTTYWQRWKILQDCRDTITGETSEFLHQEK